MRNKFLSVCRKENNNIVYKVFDKMYEKDE
jgi:hypothetical protein